MILQVKYYILVAIIAVTFFPAASGAQHGEVNELSASREAAEWSVTALAAFASYRFDSADPWRDDPLLGGSAGRSYHENTVPENYLYAGSAFIGCAIIFSPNNEGYLNYTSYVNAKGYCQALSFTLLVTAVLKNAAAKKRPSYKNYPEKDKERDGRKSFISGHSSISFSAATYGSLYLYNNTGQNSSAGEILKITAVSGLHLLAGYVAWTRVDDNKHYVSDVIAGGAAGSCISVISYLYNNYYKCKKSDNISLSSFLNGDTAGLVVSVKY